VVTILFGGLSAWLRIRLKRLKDKIGLLSSRVFDPFFLRPSHFDQYATNLILIGEGGSGKTTVVHALSGANEARPDVATAMMSTYTLVNEISIEAKGKITRRLVRIYIDDYVGQNWVQGSTNERVKARQKIVNSSTLVIVVDVVEPGSKIGPSKRRVKFQASRVKEHIVSYNDQAIQTLTELSGKDAQVILFINKMDLIYPLTDEAKSSVRQAFLPLIEKLEELRGVELHVLFGSAAMGAGVVGYDSGNRNDRSLYKLVIDHAEKISPNLLEKMRDGPKT
jgi:GTPase SAR1 family protein